jgi:hypothetical protein
MNESPQLTRLVLEAEREKGPIEFGCSKTEVWGPFGVAMLAVTFAVRKRSGRETTLLVPKDDEEAAELLEENGLLRFVQGESVVLDEWQDQIVPFPESTSAQDWAEKLSSPLAAATAKAPSVVKPCLEVLLENLQRWSESAVGGFVVLRWQKKSHKIKLAYVDRGVGIPAALRRSPSSLLHRATDIEVIEAAFSDPTVTSRIEGEPGQGLMTLRDWVLSHRGKLTVISLGAKVTWAQDKVNKGTSPALHGTAIEIEIQA